MNELLARLKLLQEEVISLTNLVNEIIEINEREKEESTNNKENPMFKIIQEIVADYFNMPVENISIKTRKQEIVQARQICHWFCLDYELGSLATIGKMIGGKDHASVIHSKKTVNNLRETDKKYREDFEEIKKKIKEKMISIE